MHPSPPTPDALRQWLRLAFTPGIGPAAMRGLAAEFGLPEDILAASRSSLDRIAGAPAASALLARDDDRERTIDAHLAWATGPRRRILTLADADYPAALLQISDPPAVLFVEGDVRWLAAPSLAIVGSRSASRGGLETAQSFAGALGEAGLVIVSGLALGIDGAAHRGALAAGAATVAVLGTGLDTLYPSEHVELAAAIVDAGGVLVAEAPLGSGPRRDAFPRRNRLIAGLALGVLVVEAAPRSGSLITARLAAECGRDVFAIPGSIHSPLSRGGHLLIKQGAKLVECAQDVLDELPAWRGPIAPGAAAAGPGRAQPVDPSGPDRGPGPADPILDAIGWDPVDAETITTRVGGDEPRRAAGVAAQLALLEIDGLIERQTDGRYLRRNRR